ncbi:MAG TPA: 6-bladed beta-propeller [Desulfuromonadaceae bacterium]|jgi:DNA-binding beta-propeller fold protein YncE
MFKVFLTIMMLIFICACSSPQVVRKRIFWPIPPNEPRIEWIGLYSTKADLQSGESSLFNMVVGDDDNFSLNGPLSIASDGMGKVYVTDGETASAYSFDFNKKDVYTLGGNSWLGTIKHVTGVSVDSKGNAYVADSSYRKIYVADKDNNPLKVLDLSAHLKSIGMFAIDKRANRLIIPDLREHKIVVTDLEGKFLFSFGHKGDEKGEFNLPVSVAVEADGTIVVCDSFNARIQRFTPQGVFINLFGKRGDGAGEFAIIKGVAVDSEGHIYVTDGKENRVSVFSTTGENLLVFGGKYAQMSYEVVAAGGFFVPQGIYIDQNDRIYIVDQRNRRFQVFQYLNTDYLSKFPVKPAVPNAK